MLKASFIIWPLALFACAGPQPLPHAPVKWSTIHETSPLIREAPAPAITAADAAVAAVVERHGAATFSGCRTPADGLAVSVYASNPPGAVFYVIVGQNFTGCGDVGDERVVDWDELYAVTADGRIVERSKAAP